MKYKYFWHGVNGKFLLFRTLGDKTWYFDTHFNEEKQPILFSSRNTTKWVSSGSIYRMEPISEEEVALMTSL